MANVSTRTTLQRTALRLFTEQGYDAVPVTAIAKAAGVSHMTFFRYFPTKESVVTDDLFDPALAAAVAAQPARLSPLRRAVTGLVAAMSAPEAMAELASDEFAQRVGLAGATPSLRGAIWASSRATEDALSAALAASGAPARDARAAAGAVMGAATAVLLAWASSGAEDDPASALRHGLTSLLEDAS